MFTDSIEQLVETLHWYGVNITCLDNGTEIARHVHKNKLYTIVRRPNGDTEIFVKKYYSNRIRNYEEKLDI